MRPDQLKSRGSNTMIYGPPMSGKTTMAMNLANQGFNILWFDLEMGADTGILVVDEDNYSNINIIQVEDTPDTPNAIATVSRFFAAKAPFKICENHGVVGCIPCSKDPEAVIQEIDKESFTENTVVVFDSLTQLSNSAMNHTLGRRPAMTTKKADWDNYSDQGQLLDFILMNAKACKYHTIFISHEGAIEQEDGSEKIMPVGGTRNYSRNVSRFFTHCIYCDRKNKKHVAYSSTTFNPKIVTGTRSGISIEEGATLADLLRPSEELQKEAKANFRKPVAQPGQATSSISKSQSLADRVARMGK